MKTDSHVRLVVGIALSAGLGLATPGWSAPGGDRLERDLQALNLPAVRRAVVDLQQTFGDRYPGAGDWLAALAEGEQGIPEALRLARSGESADRREAARFAERMHDLEKQALLSNPLLGFDRLLLVKRDARGPQLGLPQNWQGNCALPRDGYNDELVVLSPVGPEGTLTTLFKPDTPRFVGDVDLHFGGERLVFSMLGSHGRWQIWEVGADGTGLRQVTPGGHADIDNYDPCYLPDGRIVFASTRCFAGVPCVGGANAVANLCLMEADGSGIRQLCFDQDHNWCPTVLSNGRVMYTRWEYTDTPHYFTRLLMEMNPDGTAQMERYGSNSFWPNSLFYARPIPGYPSRVVAVVSGHHGVARMGELVLLDTARGRRDADGVLQRIPGFAQPVEPSIQDQLVQQSWPKFLHPWPLSDKYFLVSAQPAPSASWGLYLADIFDNLTLLHELDGYALLEPIPLRATEAPPVIPDKVRLDRTDATVFMQDVYEGAGLAGVPRGTVKALRVFEYHYSYQGIGGHRAIAVEGGWEPKRILGTVPVAEDGSALFTIPANTPISVQPLDAKGRAVQLMRSWMTAMPGEVLSCVGCHEGQNRSPMVTAMAGAPRAPVDITPWYGPPRGFSFAREVQPVLDRHCVSCHDGGAAPNLADTRRGPGGFTRSYLALHPYVRRPGPESDYQLFRPGEYHASTSELIQILEKGHQGVTLDPEAWDRLCTWIDLNAPDFGNWGEAVGEQRVTAQHQRRMEMRRDHAGVAVDPEALPPLRERPAPAPTPVAPPPPPPDSFQVEGWPMPAAEAVQLQDRAGGDDTFRTLDLGAGCLVELVRIPAGAFVMGSLEGAPDEAPRSLVRIDRPFWMSRHEITNEQYGRFDPGHDSRYIDQQHKDHTTPGYPANEPRQPVVRVSWRQAQDFCAWLGGEAGRPCALPTEAQWEWACRAGAETPFSFGPAPAEYSRHANLADRSIVRFAVSGVNPQPIADPGVLDDFIPHDAGCDDGHMICAPVGSYAGNPWGLHDMHGNVAEWTRSLYQAYPVAADDGRDCSDADGLRVVRGGSWRDRPPRATASYRLAYQPWQPVFNVGFRIVIED